MIKALTKDSVKYFVAIFCIYAINQAIWLVNDVSCLIFVTLLTHYLKISRQITLNEVLTGFGFVISAIMANRLMINVRESYYQTLNPTTNLSTRGTTPFTGGGTAGVRSSRRIVRSHLQASDALVNSRHGSRAALKRSHVGERTSRGTRTGGEDKLVEVDLVRDRFGGRGELEAVEEL